MPTDEELADIYHEFSFYTHKAALRAVYEAGVAAERERVEAAVKELRAAFARIEFQSPRDIDGERYTIPWAQTVPRDPALCEWIVDDGCGGHAERLPHDFSGDGGTCVNCFIAAPATKEGSN